MTNAIFAEGAESAYALESDEISGNLVLLSRGEGGWARLLELDSGNSYLWAFDGRVYVTGENEVLEVQVQDREFSRMPGVPAGNYVAISGVAHDSIWVANTADQVLHFDGSSWTVIGEGQGEVWSFYSDGEDVYYIVGSEFGRLTESEMVPLVTLNDYEVFASIAGAGGEIFLSIIDNEVNGFDCGGIVVLVYDGSELRWF
jgi:hypothetical protein